MYRPESLELDETHTILLEFQIQTDHLIPARRPDNLVLMNKKEKRTCGFCFSVGQHSKNKKKR